MPVTFYHDGGQCHQAAIDLLSGAQPAFLSRIGGSDTAAVVSYILDKNLPADLRAAKSARFWDLVCRFNGFYDESQNIDLYYKYCETLFSCYKSSNNLLFCNHELLSLYFKDSIHPQFYSENFDNKSGYQSLINKIIENQPDLICYPYIFVERIVFDNWTLFRAFSKILEGKKVLVISPFSESIELNFGNRQSFFKRDYHYPDFQLTLYNTPVTYAGLPKPFYPHSNWFETLAQMKIDLATMDFDIALMSCGSYALPLGHYIQDYLKKKAVYVGGVLQIYFGIMGRRYENPFFLDQINVESFIYPVERAKYLAHFTINEETAREAFGAYF